MTDYRARLMILISLGVILSTLGCVEKTEQKTEMVLSNYPKLFEKDVIIVIGENATQIEMEGAQAIANDLFTLTGNEPVIKNDADVTKNEKAGNNLVLVGNPKSNYFVKNIYILNQDLQTRAVNSYWEGTNKGSLLLYSNPWVRFWNQERYVLIVDGFDDNGTKSVVNVLLDKENIKKFNGTGIISKWDKGEISLDVADSATKQLAGSLALEYFNSKHQTYPEAHFSVTNVTSQNGDWLVEIGKFSEFRRNNETQTKFGGVSGRMLISKKTSEIKEVK